MKKSIKKILSLFVPKGNAKEKIKIYYYNLLTPSDFNFGATFENTKIIYKTNIQDISLITNESLYLMINDFSYYQHFYKVKPGDIVIDAGANCGYLSIFFSKLVGGTGRIFAFEPDKFNIDRMEKNIDLNKDLTDNITIEDLLLWDKNELIDFYEAGTEGSSAVWMPDKEHCVKKQAITIDSWVKKNNLEKLDFIKMDIEGAEIEALDGAVETIKKYRPNFTIASYHIVNGEQTFIKVEAFFRKMNYPFKTIKFKDNEIITFAGPNLK